MQTHLNQVENDYKERLERELSARNQFEKVDAICFNLLIFNVFTFQYEKVKMFLSPSPENVRHNCFNDIQFFFFLVWYDYRRLQIWKQNLRSAKQKLKLAGKQMSWVFSHSIVLVRKCMFLFIFFKMHCYYCSYYIAGSPLLWCAEMDHWNFWMIYWSLYLFCCMKFLNNFNSFIRIGLMVFVNIEYLLLVDKSWFSILLFIQYLVELYGCSCKSTVIPQKALRIYICMCIFLMSLCINKS